MTDAQTVKPVVALLGDRIARDVRLLAMLRDSPYPVLEPGHKRHSTEHRPVVGVIHADDLPEGENSQGSGNWPAPPWIAIAGFGKVRQAVWLLQRGASDYLVQPVNKALLHESLDRAAASAALDDDVSGASSQGDARQHVVGAEGEGVIGSHPTMRRVEDLVEAVAPSRATVLITGESGTGKSMIAHMIHQQSDRRDKPMVTFACGALPENLLESELFGHVKGAFTDAQQDRIGRLASAEGGTLFIDEINSATPAMQVKLLRVLQERVYEPVGSSESRHCDVRFLLATNQDLGEMIRKGLFREDLFYRINVVTIPMPALRERHGDIAALARHFVNRYAAQLDRYRELTHQAEAALEKYHWPGNVRELENAIERAVILTRDTRITVKDLPEAIQACWEGDSLITDGPASLDSLLQTLEQTAGHSLTLEEAMRVPERCILLDALKHNDWNRRQTADHLGIDRSTLYKKIKQHQLFGDA